ncbi:hypothetical protein [Vibrio splendidus]|uniref:hypothetical protein n=1 Tax=Vibrio splendidus TaxID=29497 RepID=UPI000D3911CB|nr:hypothetical protein [Vibrio splendidus]PTO54671.1 hypothetical protein CWN82_18555 [Vibrio splendidus]
MNTISKAKSLSRSLLYRMAWETQCKPLLHLNSIKTGLGTERTLDKLFGDFDDEKYAQKFLELYDGYYMQSLLAGNRTIKIFQLSADKFEAVNNAYAGAIPAKGIDTDYFPYYIDDERVDDLGRDTKLTKVMQVYEKTYFFFSTNRSITEKNDLSASVYGDSPEIVEFLEKFSKVTAFSDQSRQYIDIVCLNAKDNTLELRLDTSSAVAAKDISLLFRSVQEAFIELVPERLDFAVFVNSTNFFPLVKSVCGSEMCRVVELSFTTDDGYIHHERDRNGSKGGDVRMGEFHKGGVEKCDINPYRISARWAGSFSAELQYEYEVSLNASVRELSKTGGGQLNHAIVSMCPCETDLDALLDILKTPNELPETA